MMARPRTIQIFLPDGDPRGLRVAELTTSIMRVIEVPRALLGDFQAMPETSQVGIYFLFGDGDEANPMAYIGQTGSPGKRLTKHNADKDFWNKAVIVVSQTQNLTQTHALYLEWKSIQQAMEAGRYSLDNGNPGSRPHTPQSLQADCEDIFDTMRTLLGTLGFPLFESVAAKTEPGGTVELFYCAGGGTKGIGEYTSEGFVVHKGSKARMEAVASYHRSHVVMRQQLQDKGVLVEQDGMLVFAKDHLFGSPSTASACILGRTSNGWVDWKSKDGKTLDELKRRITNESTDD